jgi:hypothetical protein
MTSMLFFPFSLAFPAIAAAQTPDGFIPTTHTPLSAVFPTNITVSLHSAEFWFCHPFQIPLSRCLSYTYTLIQPTLTVPGGIPAEATYCTHDIFGGASQRQHGHAFALGRARPYIITQSRADKDVTQFNKRGSLHWSGPSSWRPPSIHPLALLPAERIRCARFVQWHQSTDRYLSLHWFQYYRIHRRCHTGYPAGRNVFQSGQHLWHDFGYRIPAQSSPVQYEG